MAHKSAGSVKDCVCLSLVSNPEGVSNAAEAYALLATAAVGAGTRGLLDNVAEALRVVELSPVASALIFHGHTEVGGRCCQEERNVASR